MAKKILLIEYEPRYLDRIRGYLAGKDFELIVAKDGEEGLDSYGRSRPDLVLVSSVLPKLRTPDVIKGMQAQGATPPILLMMSGYKGKNKRADAQRVGATNILEKPFSEEVFLVEIEAALGGRAAGPEPPPTASSTYSSDSLLSSDDIFSDVLSGMEEAPPPKAVSSPTGGTDPGIQKKLEQTLSGILPAPKRTSSGSFAKVEVPTSTSSSGIRPAVKPSIFEEKTQRLEALSVPTAPAPAPAVPKPPEKTGRVDMSVDKMLTDTLSGLKVGKQLERSAAAAAAELNRSGSAAAAPAPVPTPAPAPAPKPDLGLESSIRDKQKTDRLSRQAVPEPKADSRADSKAELKAAPRPEPRPEPKPEPRAVTPPAPAPRPAPRRDTVTGTSVPGGFGRYQLLEKIAAGGMAEVYKARMKGEEGFEKIVAIKRILPHMADNDDFITMFVDEAKLAAQLTHNNIIHIYDLGKVDAYHYIAMEYVEGKDLRSILKLGQERGYPLPPELGLFIASKIANALDYAHRRVGMDGKELDLVHRDVSPQNILISFEGDIKLCDFGIAKAATKVSQTQTGALKGKLQYMSPEQAWGKKIDRRTDIFSLGIVLFEMLTGERLFTGDTDLTILEQVRDAKVVVPSARNPEIPKKVDQIVLRSLAKNPQERYQNCSEMEKEINSVLYSFQPAPGPADLAIYMHRLLEAQPVASDEQIDAAFAKAELAPMPAVEQKKGKGLVISKKAPAPEKLKVEERRPTPPPPSAPLEVSAPALSIGHEPSKSRTGLFVGIGAAAAVLIGGGIFLMKGKGGGSAPQPTAVPVATAPSTGTAAPPATSAAAPTVAPEATKILDQAALAAAVKEEMRKREEEARKKLTPVAGAAAAPTQAPAPPASVSLNPVKPIQPPKGAEQPTPAPPPTQAPPPPKPTEVPKIAEVKPAPAEPKPAEPAPAAAEAAVKEGDLVGEGPDVVDAKLVKLGSINLPQQLRAMVKSEQRTMILALVNENGVVTDTRVIKPSSYKFVDEAALNALKTAKIEPATKKGVRVKKWQSFVIPVKP